MFETDDLEKLRLFLKNRDPNCSIFVGIDPGVSGAIGFICGNEYLVLPIPTTKVEVRRTRKNSEQQQQQTGKKTRTITGSTTKFDLAAIWEMFALLCPFRTEVRIALEEIPPSLGPGKRHAEILLNRAYAMWPLFLHSHGFSFREVPPREWKKYFSLLNKDKEASRLKAMTLFPSVSLSRKKDHDKAEALLLTQYLKEVSCGRPT